jgi:hypothetical protein
MNRYRNLPRALIAIAFVTAVLFAAKVPAKDARAEPPNNHSPRSAMSSR